MEIKAEVRQFFDVDVDALAISIFEGEKPDHGLLKEIDERIKLLGNK